MLRGLFYIFFFYFLGELLSLLIQGFIPGSVIGMLLLFFSLWFKLLNPEAVRQTATKITRNMAIFFVPTTVGVMAYTQLFAESMLSIFVSIIVSTILTMLVVGWLQQYLESKKGGKQNV